MTVLGGATPTLNSLNKENLGFFVGCVQDVVINGQSVNAEESNVNVTLVQGVKKGCERTEQCPKNRNPCSNFGTCTDLWQKFECKCQRPLGQLCQEEYKAGTFGHESTNRSIAEIRISPEVSRKFSHSFDISMFVRTRAPNGTIFFLGDESRGLFLEAQVEEDGQLGVISKLDEVKEETYTVGGSQINDGIPHLINIQKEKRLVKISINGTEHFRKSVKEKVQFHPTIMFVGGVLPSTSEANDTSNDFEDSTVLPGAEPTPTKATPAINSLILGKMKPFKGVIQDVRVNLSATDVPPTASSHDHFVVEFFPLHLPLDYSMGQSLGNVTLHGEVLEGVRSDNTCKINPCLNGGTCTITWNDYQCHCTPDVYIGKQCEQMLRCAMVNCPDNSECRNIDAVGFECVSDVAFDGRRNISPHYVLQSQKMDGLSFQKVSFRYRSRAGGSVLYLGSRNSSVRVAVESGNEDSATTSSSVSTSSSNTMGVISVYLNGVRHSTKVENALDGDWHDAEVGIDIDNHLMLHFDKVVKGKVAKDTLLSSNLFNDIVLQPGAQIIVGSNVKDVGSQYEILSDASPRPVVSHPESLHDSLFRGCLSSVKVGNYELPFVSPDQLYAVNSNRSLVEVTAPTAFYIDSGSLTPPLGCVLCYDSECKNGGNCENATTSYDCACADGYSSATSPKLCEVNIDECVHNECASGSSCIDGIANYTCSCRAGTTGWLCSEDIDECSIENNGKYISPCKNGGSCINLDRVVFLQNQLDRTAFLENHLESSNLNADDGFYKCNCTSDFQGPNCEKRKLTTCQKNNEPCENDGKCRPLSTPKPDGVSFRCDCATGYEGIVCEKITDYCENKTCKHGGTCHSTPHIGFMCACQPGYDGLYCDQEIDECATEPCQNNGVCEDLINGYRCNCNGTGFYGQHCEIDINECENEEIQEQCSYHMRKYCENTRGSYICRCEDGMCGEHCTIDDPCVGKNCSDHSVCEPHCVENEQPEATCKCDPGYGGDLCETHLSAKRDQTLNIALIVIPVITAFLLAVVIAILVLVRMARKKRATRGVYSPSQQEYCNPRVELDNVMKPPPEERLI